MAADYLNIRNIYNIEYVMSEFNNVFPVTRYCYGESKDNIIAIKKENNKLQLFYIEMTEHKYYVGKAIYTLEDVDAYTPLYILADMIEEEIGENILSQKCREFSNV